MTIHRFADDRAAVNVEDQATHFEAAFPKTAAVLTQVTEGIGDTGDGTYGKGPKAFAQYVLGATDTFGETTEWSKVFTGYAFNWKDNPVSRVAWAGVNVGGGIIDLVTLHGAHHVADKLGVAEYLPFLSPQPTSIRGWTHNIMSIGMLAAVPEGLKTAKVMAREIPTVAGKSSVTAMPARVPTYEYAPVLMPLHLLAAFRTWWAGNVTMPRTFDFKIQHGRASDVVNAVQGRLQRVAQESIAQVIEAARTSDGASSALQILADQNPQLFSAEHVPVLVELAKTNANVASALQTLAMHQLPFSRQIVVGLIEAAKTSDRAGQAIQALAGHWSQLFTRANLTVLCEVAKTNAGIFKAIGDLAQLTPDLFSAEHVSVLVELAKTREGAAIALRILARHKSQFAPQIVDGLLEAAKTGDGASKAILDLAKQGPGLFGILHKSALLKLAETRGHIKLAVQHLSQQRPELFSN